MTHDQFKRWLGAASDQKKRRVKELARMAGKSDEECLDAFASSPQISRRFHFAREQDFVRFLDILLIAGSGLVLGIIALYAYGYWAMAHCH